MLKHMVFVLCVSVVPNYFGQSSFFTPSDTLNKHRLIPSIIGVSSVWTGGMIGLAQIWYKEVPKSKFHTFDDCSNWMQMDKLGHFYTANKLNKVNYELFRWSGLEKRSSLIIGAGVSIGFQTTLEILDAHSEEWGFSWCDFGANILGTASYTSQQLLWNEERIHTKFSYHPTKFAELRPEILGSSFSESLLKDYNGQTYWISFSPGTFLKQSSFPKWACLSFGYSVTSKIIGDKDYYLDPLTWKSYHAKRQYLFSIDIDFDKLEVRRTWMRVLLHQLNYLKIPFPALIIEDGKFGVAPFYF